MFGTIPMKKRFSVNYFTRNNVEVIMADDTILGNHSQNFGELI
jgi:hypothetical protein